MPDTLASTPPSPTAGAQKRKAEEPLQADTEHRSRRRAGQGREYELIWLLQQRLRAVVIVCVPIR